MINYVMELICPVKEKMARFSKTGGYNLVMRLHSDCSWLESIEISQKYRLAINAKELARQDLRI